MSLLEHINKRGFVLMADRNIDVDEFTITAGFELFDVTGGGEDIFQMVYQSKGPGGRPTFRTSGKLGQFSLEQPPLTAEAGKKFSLPELIDYCLAVLSRHLFPKAVERLESTVEYYIREMSEKPIQFTAHFLDKTQLKPYQQILAEQSGGKVAT